MQIMFVPPNPLFIAKPIVPERHTPVSGFVASPEKVPIAAGVRDVATRPTNHGAWGLPSPPQTPWTPEWCDDVERKKAFATRLAKGDRPYDAAMLALGNDQQGSLWAIQQWVRDPLVIETRELVENSVNLLDKEQLCVKLLKMADEKINGQFIHEMKDRTAALKLYAEIQGHIGKVNVDLSNKTFVNNEMKITFVEAEPEKQDVKTIEHRAPVSDHDNALPINLKLVG